MISKSISRVGNTLVTALDSIGRHNSGRKSYWREEIDENINNSRKKACYSLKDYRPYLPKPVNGFLDYLCPEKEAVDEGVIPQKTTIRHELPTPPDGKHWVVPKDPSREPFLRKNPTKRTKSKHLNTKPIKDKDITPRESGEKEGKDMVEQVDNVYDRIFTQMQEEIAREREKNRRDTFSDWALGHALLQGVENPAPAIEYEKVALKKIAFYAGNDVDPQFARQIRDVSERQNLQPENLIAYNSGIAIALWDSVSRLGRYLYSPQETTELGPGGRLNSALKNLRSLISAQRAANVDLEALIGEENLEEINNAIEIFRSYSSPIEPENEEQRENLIDNIMDTYVDNPAMRQAIRIGYQIYDNGDLMQEHHLLGAARISEVGNSESAQQTLNRLVDQYYPGEIELEDLDGANKSLTLFGEIKVTDREIQGSIAKIASLDGQELAETLSIFSPRAEPQASE